jgi:RNA polymerase-binding transcription factor DksA
MAELPMIISPLFLNGRRNEMTQAKKQTTGGKQPAKSKGTVSPTHPHPKGSGASRKKASPSENPSSKTAVTKVGRLDAKDRKRIRETLVALRDDLAGQVSTLKHDSLKRDDEVNNVEDGTDAFERQFALSLASSEQEAVGQINEALRQLEDGTYGACEQCQSPIEKARLEALPFVKTCITCQSAMEKGGGKFRAGMGASNAEPWDETRTTGIAATDEEE